MIQSCFALKYIIPKYTHSSVIHDHVERGRRGTRGCRITTHAEFIKQGHRCQCQPCKIAAKDAKQRAKAIRPSL